MNTTHPTQTKTARFPALLLSALLAGLIPADAATQTVVHYTGQLTPLSAGLPLASTWKTLGRPSLTQQGTWVGFSATFATPGFGLGVFDGPSGSPFTCVLFGQNASTKLAPAVIFGPSVYFGKFFDPVFGDPEPLVGGKWAVISSLKTTFILANGLTCNQGLWTGIGTQHRAVAFKNDDAYVPLPVGNNLGVATKLSAFRNIQMTPGGTLFYTATLKDGTLTKNSLWRYQFDLAEYNLNNGICLAPSSLVLCVGQTIAPDPINFAGLTGTVLDIQALGEGTDITPSHGRVDALNNTIPIHYRLLHSSSSTIYDVSATVNAGGILTTVGMSYVDGFYPGPGLNLVGSPQGFFGPDLPAGGAPVSTIRMLFGGSRVMDRNVPAYLATSAGSAPDFIGGPSGFNYVTPTSTVSGLDSSTADVSVVFKATRTAPAVLGTTGIFSNANPSQTMRLVANNHGLPPGFPLTAQYTAFRWLSHMDGKGPLFEATVINGTGSYGLWGCDPGSLGIGGDAQLLLRWGDTLPLTIGFPVGPKTIKTFDCLSKVSYSMGQRRAWSYDAAAPVVRPVITRVRFLDGTYGIVRITY